MNRPRPTLWSGRVHKTPSSLLHHLRLPETEETIFLTLLLQSTQHPLLAKRLALHSSPDSLSLRERRMRRELRRKGPRLSQLYAKKELSRLQYEGEVQYQRGTPIVSRSVRLDATADSTAKKHFHPSCVTPHDRPRADVADPSPPQGGPSTHLLPHPHPSSPPPTERLSPPFPSPIGMTGSLEVVVNPVQSACEVVKEGVEYL